MPTLADFGREMINRAPGLIGRVETISSLATGSVTCSALGFGGSSQQFVDAWLLRREAASQPADRMRRCSGFTPSSGALAHSGANYADTTATNEELEILWPEYEPYMVDQAVQVVLSRLRREDQTEIPTLNNSGRYWIHGLDWIRQESDVLRVRFRPAPGLGVNQYFEKWNSYSSSGVLQPDSWTLAGSGATCTRDTTGAVSHKYTAKITRATNDATLTQSAGLLETGVAGDSLRGKVVTVFGVVTASSASQARLFVNDGVTTTYSDYHTGGGGRELLSKEITVDAAATQLTFGVEVKVDGSVYVARCAAVIGDADDQVLRDDYPESDVPYTVENEGTIRLDLPNVGEQGQYIIHSMRPYPQFVASRVAGGTADADSSDAPLVHVATGALGRLFEAVAAKKEEGPDKVRLLRLALEWSSKFEQLAMMHQKHETPAKPGLPWPSPLIGGGPRGWR